MKFFVDSADVKEIRELEDLGLVDGVTTNPSLIMKSGGQMRDVIKEICGVVKGPVSAEVTATDYEGMVRQAALLGADVATIPPATIRVLSRHPRTDKGLETFLADWKKPGQTIGRRDDRRWKIRHVDHRQPTASAAICADNSRFPGNFLTISDSPVHVVHNLVKTL